MHSIAVVRHDADSTALHAADVHQGKKAEQAASITSSSSMPVRHVSSHAMIEKRCEHMHHNHRESHLA
jgi:hypothetical protein